MDSQVSPVVISDPKWKSLTQFPCEILNEILTYLTLKELAIFRCLCKRLQALAEDKLSKVTHLKVNPVHGSFPLTSVVLFDSSHVTTVNIQPHLLRDLCSFLSKYCPKLAVLDAPDCSIGINSLQRLATNLEYFCLYSPGGYGQDGANFGDVAARTLTKLKAFDFSDKKNVLKATLFYHRKFDLGMGQFIQWQHLLGMNNLHIPPRIRSLTTSAVSPDSIRSIHETVGGSLQFLDLQFCFQCINEFNATSFRFPSLVSVVLRNFSRKFCWFLEIVTKSPNLTSLYILGKFRMAEVSHVISNCSNLKNLALVYKSRNESKFEEQPATWSIYNEKLSLIELTYPTSLTLDEFRCNRLQFLQVSSQIDDLPVSLFFKLRKLSLNQLSSQVWTKLTQNITQMTFLKSLHLESSVNIEFISLKCFMNNLALILPQLNQLDLKLKPTQETETIDDFTIDLTQLPFLIQINLDVPFVEWSIVIDDSLKKTTSSKDVLYLENDSSLSVHVQGKYNLKYN